MKGATVGRIVHYIRIVDGNLCEPTAAIVTATSEKGLICATTFPYGTAPVFLSTWIIHESKLFDGCNGFWRWPPRVES